MAIYEASDEYNQDWPLLMAMVCWNCQYVQFRMGRYSSRGPRCGECGTDLETYKVME